MSDIIQIFNNPKKPRAWLPSFFPIPHAISMQSSLKTMLHHKENQSIGVVITFPDGTSPNITEFSFILSSHDLDEIPIKHGQFVMVESGEGIVIGIIDQIRVDNQYFQNIQTVKNFDIARLDIQSYFPSEEWECHIVDVNVLGVVPLKKNISELSSQDISQFRKFKRVGFPVKPGNNVYIIEKEFLREFLGLQNIGLNIGKLQTHDLSVQLNLNRLFSKHLAILAQSGAGKSYLISVLLEELLQRPRETTPAMILIDVHGEYKYLANKFSDVNVIDGTEIEGIQKRVDYFNVSFLQIGVPNLSVYDLKQYQPAISTPQLRELQRIKDQCDAQNKKDNYENGYDLKEIIFGLNDDPDINSKVKDTLVSWLYDLERLRIFGKKQYPRLSEIANLGKLTIIDLSSMVSMRKKQILVHYFVSQLFNARRSGKVAPFILFLEEAHNFLPERDSSLAFAKNVLETIAREGRKFFAQLVLISQRPVHLSTTALSQCNSQIILRVTNPYDLDHIKATSEALTRNALNLISTLPTGNALILGRALNFPVFFQVRQKKFPNSQDDMDMEGICQQFGQKYLFEEQNHQIVRSEDSIEK